MQRREFIAGVGSTIVWTTAARAQQSGAMRRIGVLLAPAESDPHEQRRLTAFRQGLAKLGWIDGGNVRIDYRYAADDIKLMGPLATELVGLRPDVLLAGGTATVTALRQATRSIPIVFFGLNDPIGAGFVQSLARPGGNITGLILTEPALASKWIELLKETTPGLQRALFLFNPETGPRASEYLQYAESAAARLKVEIIAAAVRDERGVEDAFVTLARKGDGGLAVYSDGFNRLHRHQIIALATRYRLPVVYPYRFYAEDGGLISYGTDSIDVLRQAAPYVDRILRGEKPTDLPVQTPTRFELVINLKTAKALGLTIPETLLATADELIK